MFANNSSRSATAATVYPCSRSSQDRAPETTGCPSATTMRPPVGGASVAKKVTKPRPLDVATAHDGNHRSITRIYFPLEQRSDRNSATRLHYQLHSIEQQPHRTAQRRVVDENDIVDVALMVRERHRSDFDRQQTVGQPAGAIES